MGARKRADRGSIYQKVRAKERSIAPSGIVNLRSYKTKAHGPWVHVWKYTGERLREVHVCRSTWSTRFSHINPMGPLSRARK